MRKEVKDVILEKNFNEIIEVELDGGKCVKGRLKWFDQHLNLVLETKSGFVLIRGSRVAIISNFDFSLPA